MLAGRAVLNTIIQSSMVDLFRSVGIVVAPMPHLDKMPTALPQYLGGSVSFAGNAMNGALSLLVPVDVIELSRDDGLRSSSPIDFVRELTNQLMGRLRNRLSQYQTELRAGLPVGLHGASLQTRAQEKPFALYGFRTLRGEVVVTLTGNIDCSNLVYSWTENAAQEGDIILF